jgi:hypothetical protein
MRAVVGLFVAVLALSAPWATAVRADEPAAPPATPAASPPVGEVRPEIYYLKDDAGRLVPVPGFRYRDFLELFRLREGLPATLEPPAVVLESIVVRCDLVRADAAAGTCPATVECVVRQTRPGWASVPLGFDGLLLSDPPRHEGPGRMVVDADPAGGYRGWFDAPADAGDVRHTLRFEGSLPVELGETYDAIGMRLPVATAATVVLRTARDRPEAVVVPPMPGRPVVERASDRSSTVTLAGLAGAVRVRLTNGGAAAAEWDAVPQCTVESVVRIDGRSAFIDAAIRLEGLRPGAGTIDVTLPPRTTLRGVRSPATLVARGGTADAPTVTVAIDGDRNGRAAVELECERPVDPSGAATFEAIGFAVAQVEAWRQWGRVSLVVEGEWRAEWVDRPGVRRVDPPPAARRTAFVAAFAYDALPASLPVRVRPRVGRVAVEPEYRYEIGATRIALAARLRIVARGAPAAALVVDVDPGFDVDEVGPPGIVDAAGVAVEAGRVTIPFLQPLSGDAVVEMRGIRRIDRDTGRLAWRVPVPRADIVAPADVVVTADSDIEIVPDAAASIGLVRQASSGRALGDGQAALVYRMDGVRGTFAATRRFLPRRIDAVVTVRARLDDVETAVTETIALDVAHVPLEYLELLVPARVVEGSDLEIRQGGMLLEPFAVGGPNDAGASAETSSAERDGATRLVRAVLAEPILGAGEVTVSYRLPTASVPPETTVASELPLALPLDALVERQAVAIESGDRLSVEVRGDGWRPEATTDPTTRSWTAARPQEAVPLAIAARRRADVDAVVEASWLRTIALPDRREDIAIFVLSGGGESVTVAVPAPIDALACSVALDGVSLPATRDAAGRFSVALPRAAAGRRRVLEVRVAAAQRVGWMAIGARLGLPTRLMLEPPVFSAGVAQRRFYWEILTRPDEHAIGAPDAWTAQQRWGSGIAPQPTVASATLAAWIGDAAGAAASVLPAAEPPLVSGRLVYSGLGPPGTAVLWLVPTWAAVLVASGVALGIGLTLAYVPAARQPACVVPLIATGGVAAALLPDLAPLVARAALPGVGLALVAWALRLVLDRDAVERGPRAMAPVSASSLTRAVSPPVSLVLSGSSPGRTDSVTASGRPLS